MKKQNSERKRIVAYICLSFFFVMVNGFVIAEDADLNDLEIRVIRPRYIDKGGHLEVGLQLSNIVNQDFVNIFMFSGLLQYHFIHSLGMEIGGAYGLVAKNVEYNILEDNLFSIKIKKYNPNYLVDGGFNWSPFYGKFQVASGLLLYFDTFISVGGGLTGIQLSYEHCGFEDGEEAFLPDSIQALSGRVGIGQHFFIDAQNSIRWDFKYNMFFLDQAHGECEEGAESNELLESNFVLKLGYSFFL